MYKQQIEQSLKELGLDTYGFIPVRRWEELRPFYEERKEKRVENEFEEKDVELRIDPTHYMEEGKTILSIAFPYAGDEELLDNGFSVYTRRTDYHRVVKQYLGQLCEEIERLGGKAMAFVDSNTLPERYLAFLAGVGTIGRNNMIITEKYGSYVFLGEIMMDLAIPCKEARSFAEIKDYTECKDCTNCIKECPTKSINLARINPNICLSYLTQKKELTDQEMKLLKGNVFGCDFCQYACPLNEGVQKNVLPEFQMAEFMNEEAEVFAGMENKFFKENVNHTSCGWRGKNVIRRNAILRLHREGKEIAHYQGDSPYINEYIVRALKEQK